MKGVIYRRKWNDCVVFHSANRRKKRGPCDGLASFSRNLYPPHAGHVHVGLLKEANPSTKVLAHNPNTNSVEKEVCVASMGKFDNLLSEGGSSYGTLQFGTKVEVCNEDLHELFLGVD
ncbi:Uncharacterized protein Adt_17639 [Abeliophyllum distichum]|uniref:Uncharacterized protein n=1 Tax=Abeliophyllum distichum TaxID=126358 RepID=A0ABD1TH35_9LAMI